MSSAASPCPRCGHPASGNFCATCGAGLVSTRCTGCDATLSPGAAFCHRCGKPATPGAATPAGTPATTPAGNVQAPWIIAALLVVIAISGVVYALRGRNAPAAANMPNVGNAAGGPTGPAPDISNLSPKERFARLNDRVMTAAEKGDTTTIFTFWPMALGAYQNLGDADRDIDTRYHMATLYLMLTQYPEVKALADTIQMESPNNLFGFYLHGMAAEFQGDSAGARAARTQFRKFYPDEIKKEQTEYLDHRPVLDQYFRQGDGPK